MPLYQAIICPVWARDVQRMPILIFVHYWGRHHINLGDKTLIHPQDIIPGVCCGILCTIVIKLGYHSLRLGMGWPGEGRMPVSS